MGGFVSWLVSGALSPILGAVSTILNKKEDTALEKYKVDGNVDIAHIDAVVQLAKMQNELRASKALQFLIVAFGTPLAIYYGKVLLWDAAFHLGSTDAIRGDVANWNMMIVTFIFGAAGLANWRK